MSILNILDRVPPRMGSGRETTPMTTAQHRTAPHKPLAVCVDRKLIGGSC